MKTQKIEFLIFDWKDTDGMIEEVMKYANKRYFFQSIDSSDDNYIIAISKDKLTKARAQKAFNDWE